MNNKVLLTIGLWGFSGYVFASCNADVIEALKTELNTTSINETMDKVYDQVCGKASGRYAHVEGHIEACRTKNLEFFRRNIEIYSKTFIDTDQLRIACRHEGLTITPKGGNLFNVSWNPHHVLDYREDRIIHISDECEQDLVGATINENGRTLNCRQPSKYEDYTVVVETLLDSETYTVKGEEKPVSIYTNSDYLECPSGGCGNNRRENCLDSSDGYSFNLETLELISDLSGNGSQADFSSKTPNRICWWVDNFTGITKAKISVRQDPD